VREEIKNQERVLRFVLENIDSVPELEALLLLWQHRPVAWNLEELAKRLYISPEQTHAILAELSRKQLVVPGTDLPDTFSYHSSSEERDHLIEETASVYRREIIRISTLIHSKPSAAIRDFARAFRFTKENP
jgi:DNA-binding MarR family transcriptional regulator